MSDNVVPIRAPDPVPEHIAPHTITDMSEDDLLKMVEGIRVRRLRAFEDYSRAEQMRSQERRAQVLVKLDKKMNQFMKSYTKLDEDCTKLEKLAFDLKALRIQHSDTM